jgi:hypothetical protein
MFKQIITCHLRLIGLIVIKVIVSLIPFFIHSPYYPDLEFPHCVSLFC